MKKLKLQLDESKQVLSREQMKKISGGYDYGCHNMSWSDCMQCLLVAHCAGDWACVAACALAPEACIGGAAVICLFN